MSKITGNEPGHWHDADGRHRMTDPRKIHGPQPVKGQPGVFSTGLDRRFWGDPDAVRYAEHLDAHDAMVTDLPTRSDDDSDLVKALFDTMENAQNTARTSGEMIKAYRKAGK